MSQKVGHFINLYPNNTEIGFYNYNQFRAGTEFQGRNLNFEKWARLLFLMVIKEMGRSSLEKHAKESKDTKVGGGSNRFLRHLHIYIYLKT